MAKGKLTDAVRAFIVQSVACFDTPSTVFAAVRKDFDEEVMRQTVEGYNPTKRAGQGLSPKWRKLFEETRRAFLEDTAATAISHRAVRLRALQRMAEKAEEGVISTLSRNLFQAVAAIRRADETIPACAGMTKPQRSDTGGCAGITQFYRQGNRPCGPTSSIG